MRTHLSEGRPGGSASFAAVISLALIAVLGSDRALAQDEEPGSPTATVKTEEPAETEEDPRAATFLESVTVTATRSPRALKDTAGTVSVIDADEIETRGVTDARDLVLYEPGVYVANDVARLGLSGFNIRGIGDNRVLTQIDGIRTIEQFDFGPFAVAQYSLDVDTLESVEIVRSAGSSLYGSDALGGVVSLVTRDPASYLADGGSPFVGFKVGYDGRDEELGESLTVALGSDRWQGSLLVARRDGRELDNQGTIASEDGTRTEPNPRDHQSLNLLGKLVHRPSDRSTLELTAEWLDTEAETQVLSGQGLDAFGATVLDFDAIDVQERTRLSVEHDLRVSGRLLDTLFWRAYRQAGETLQTTLETRAGGAGTSFRDGGLSFEQETLGGEVQLQKYFQGKAVHLLTYGVAVSSDRFDQLRDRTERFVDTGEDVPTSLVLPTKYFPASRVRETGVYLQDEIELAGGRLRLVPGLRFDGYDLNADQGDEVYLAGNPGGEPPVDITEEAVSPKLGLVASLSERIALFGQYARGFRAPPMSSVNNGFTNPAGGYTTLPNPDLEPETSDNLEVGVRGVFRRGSFRAVYFDNRYDDFIEIAVLPFDPRVGLLEFQPRNVDDASISGIELGGELRLSRSWTLRGSYAAVEGDNETESEPLLSIAPPRLVVGLRYRGPAARWGGELSSTFASTKAADDVPSDSGQFLAPGYEVLDLTAYYRFAGGLSVQAGLCNALDATYWPWPNVQGRPASASNLDFYTSPGRSFAATLRYSF